MVGCREQQCFTKKNVSVLHAAPTVEREAATSGQGQTLPWAAAGWEPWFCPFQLCDLGCIASLLCPVKKSVKWRRWCLPLRKLWVSWVQWTKLQVLGTLPGGGRCSGMLTVVLCGLGQAGFRALEHQGHHLQGEKGRQLRTSSPLTDCTCVPPQPPSCTCALWGGRYERCVWSPHLRLHLPRKACVGRLSPGATVAC